MVNGGEGNMVSRRLFWFFCLLYILERTNSLSPSSLTRLGSFRSRLILGSTTAQRDTIRTTDLAEQNDRNYNDDNDNDDDIDYSKPNLDAMRARAGVLRSSILRQQLELQQLERSIICCQQGGTSQNSNPFLIPTRTFAASLDVLLRKLDRVRNKIGKDNHYKNMGEFVTVQTATGVRIVSNLFQNPERLKHLVDPDTPTLVPHVPAIIARLDKLEGHVAPILERVLNNRRHLASIEPYLPEILERFDDIEPHLPWILDNIDALAPYCGLLLKHIDTLLLYAETDASDEEYQNYSLAEEILPFLEYYVSKLDLIAPHLPLLRPHVPKLVKYNRIAKISPHIDKLFQRGYKDLSASANMDVLLFYFGWCLRIPGLPRLFFAFPGSPRMVSFLANRLPKRFVRGSCCGVSCSIDGDYGSSWNKLKKGVPV